MVSEPIQLHERRQLTGDDFLQIQAITEQWKKHFQNILSQEEQKYTTAVHALSKSAN